MTHPFPTRRSSDLPRGTAYRARIKEEGFELAGKTGTSQVRRITMAERAAGVTKNEQLPWRRRDHALFVARSEEHTSELQSVMRTSYAVFCLKKKTTRTQ